MSGLDFDAIRMRQERDRFGTLPQGERLAEPLAETRTAHYTRALAINQAAIERAAASTFPDNGWSVRHAIAFANTGNPAPTSGRGIAQKSVTFLLRAWLLYADAHSAMYESGIGADHVLGDEWAKIGYALRGLLNGELGDLDGGTCDHIIADALDTEGFDPDTEERKK